MPTDRAALEESVTSLRQMHAGADDGRRNQAALLFGLAAADLAGSLPADDPRRAELAKEGLCRLGECDLTAQPPGTIEAVEATRAALDAFVSPPLPPRAPAAAPAPPTPGSVPPPPASADRPRWVPEGVAFRGSVVDPAQAQHMMGLARGMLPGMSADNPLRLHFQLIVWMADALEAVGSGRWKPEHDEMVLEMGRLAAGDLPAPLDQLLPAFEAMMRGVRCQQINLSPVPAEHAGAEELDETIAALEAGIERIQDAEFAVVLVPMMHFLAGTLLVQRANLISGSGDSWGRPVPAPVRRLFSRARAHVAEVPPDVADVGPVLAAITVAEDGPAADEQAFRDLDRAAEVHGEWAWAGGGELPEAQSLAARARQTMALADIAAAIDKLSVLRRDLPAGHPAHAAVLAMLASMRGLRATRTQAPGDVADALNAGIEAVRAGRPPALDVAGHLIGVLSIGAMLDLRSGPYEQAGVALADALAAADPGDSWLRLSLLTGVGAARYLCWRTSRDDGTRQLARQALDEAEALLPPPSPTDQWLAPAWALFGVNSANAMLYSDPEASAATVRMIDRLDGLLTAHPALAERLAGQTLPGGLAQLNLPGDGTGVLHGLRQLKQLLPKLSMLSSVLPADTGQDGVFAQVSGALGRFQQGNAGGPVDIPSMMQAVVAQLRQDPETMRTAMSAAMGVPIAPPPPAAEETRRLARRGLARAGDALGTDRAPASVRRPLSPAGRPEPAALRLAVADLRAAVSGGLDDAKVRQRVQGTLGVCLAEAYWLGAIDPPDGAADDPAGRTLADAIEHLDRSLTGSEHGLPTLGRVDLLDVLARCYREANRVGLRADTGHEAERLGRAALRELARCVLVADGTEQALGVAARANGIVARVVGWCLADGRPRAAVEVAESGRSLVLAAVVLAGQLEEFLRALGQDAVADGWRRGDEPGRLAGLRAVSATVDGQWLLTNLSADEVSQAVVSSGLDAAVYLVPPVPFDGPAAEPAPAVDPPGHALLVRPGHTVEVLELPGLAVGDGTPLAGYLVAFGAALDAFDPHQHNPDGFRSHQPGQTWLAALEDLGGWTYQRIVGPLVAYTRAWDRGRPPQLALVPLGLLGAIPYAAAWTGDAGLPGGRRYAVHDLVLSYTVSARLLADVVRRPRRRLAERVVLFTDPTGRFRYARATANLLVEQLYPGAERYGRSTAPSGLATTDALLAALPGPAAPGASLLHLSTHGTTVPTAQLQTLDGWLPLSRILAAARGRPPESSGGLVITSACLTDSTSAHFDESLTLATALLAAGATGLIGTRWPIDDDTAAALTHLLHHRLAEGHPPAQALRLAQLGLIDPQPPALRRLHPHLAALPTARLAHPASWAGFVHHGR